MDGVGVELFGHVSFFRNRQKQRQSGKKDGVIEAERDGEMERQKGRETETWTEKEGGGRERLCYVPRAPPPLGAGCF